MSGADLGPQMLHPTVERCGPCFVWDLATDPFILPKYKNPDDLVLIIMRACQCDPWPNAQPCHKDHHHSNMAEVLNKKQNGSKVSWALLRAIPKEAVS